MKLIRDSPIVKFWANTDVFVYFAFAFIYPPFVPGKKRSLHYKKNN